MFVFLSFFLLWIDSQPVVAPSGPTVSVHAPAGIRKPQAEPDYPNHKYVGGG